MIKKGFSICVATLLMMTVFASYPLSVEGIEQKSEGTRIDFGTFEYGADEFSQYIWMEDDKTAKWIFYGDGEKLKEIETNDVRFDWSDHGDFDKKEFKVDVEDYMDVKRIQWTHDELTGEIPPELGELSNLERLYLKNNELTGEIPSELGKLRNLKYLDLRSNELTGEIPPELGDLKDLERLYLQSNELTGEIPSELGELSNVLSFYLHDNELEGIIPPELGKLSIVEYFDLRSNELTGEIPSELNGFKEIQWLKLDSNRLRGEIPPELYSLSTLEILYLGENELSGEIPSELGELSRLEELDLGDNDIHGEIPSEIGDLSNLVQLDLSRNELIGEIPSELSNLINLRSLKLQENRLRGYGTGAFSTQPSLGDLYSVFEVLDLSENDLSSEDIDAILSDLVESLDLEDRKEAEVDLTRNSPPSSNGLRDKEILEEEGWTVEVERDEEDNEGTPAFMILVFFMLVGTTTATLYYLKRNEF